MEEEKEIENKEVNENEIDNKENQDNASSNSSQSNKKDNKYRSRKNSKKLNDNSSSRVSPKKGTIGNSIKNYAANKALDKVSNAHPALKAIAIANSIRNANQRKKAQKEADNQNKANGDVRTGNTDSTNNYDDTNDISPNNDNEENTNEERTSFNPFRSILGTENEVSGRFSFLGKIPLPIKIAVIVAFPLLIILLILLICLYPFYAFSSLLGLDNNIVGSNNTGTIDYGDYTLSSDGDLILNQSLESFLSSNGSSLEEFNNLIASNVNEAGYGTRAGVVAAAVTLIAELGNNYDVKIPYFYSGGHDAISNYANGVWGAGSCHTYANGVFYDRCGLDCSGFVSWAVSNGGFNVSITSSGGFQNLPGAERVSLQDSAVLQPGDILETNGHVILVVGIEDNQYVCAEASGKITGVIFSRHSFNMSGYWGVKMDGFYNMQVRS